MYKYSWPALCVVILFSSCISTRKTVKKEITLEPVIVKASNSVYRAAADKQWDIVHTRVQLSFNWAERTAQATAWIDIHPYFYPSDTLVLDAKSMEIENVMLKEGNEERALSYFYQNDKLYIYPGMTLAKDTIQLRIKYKAMPYANKTGGSAAITDDRGLYFINADNAIAGKPIQIWTQGETESNSHWLPTIDKPNERFTTRIELLVPDTMQTLSNGYWAASTREPGHIRKDIWVMDKPIQTYAIMFAIGRFDITKEEWRGREVSYYAEPAFAPYTRKIFNHTPEMMEYFSTITGVPYPWIKYSQIIARDYVSGAMENTSATLFGEFMNQTPRELLDKDFEDVVSHELFHQWFGDYVTAESWSNITLNESFANYGEQLWRRHQHGDESADRLGYNDQLNFLQTRGADAPLVRYYYNDKEDVFDRISYEKGGAILHYMHGIMGNEAFYKAMNIYLTKNSLHSAEVANWRMAVEEATGQDWNWYFNQWYFHGSYPKLTIKYDYDDSAQNLTVRIKQESADSSAFLYRLPLKTVVINGNEKTTVDWLIENRTTIYTYPYKNGVKPVIVPDIHHWLVGTILDLKKPEQWLQQFVLCNNYVSKRRAVATAYNYISDSNARQILTLALTDSMYSIREYALNMLRWVKEDKWRKVWEPQVTLMAFSDSKNAVRAAAFDVLTTWKTNLDKEQLLQTVYDSSYAVAGAALNALYIADSEKAYSVAVSLLNTSPKATLQSAIWATIGKKGNDADLTVFETKSILVYGADKFMLANGLYQYLIHIHSDISFEKGVNIMANMTMNEGIKSYRLVMGGYLFDLKKVYADNKSDSKEKREQYRIRREILQHSIDKIMAAETDEGNLKQYKEMSK